MGAIVDRTQEYLGTCDRVIYRARMLLLDAVTRFRDTGELSFTGDAIDFAAIRAVSFAFGKDEDWRDFDAHELAAIAAE